MVSQPADTIVTALLDASACIRIDASDPRSDNRRRVVEITREAVTIRRAVSGVSMAIRLAVSAYRGVSLRVAGLEDGRFHYEVWLAHRDSDLSARLDEGEDFAAIEALWRAWVGFLRLPALAGRSESADSPVNVGDLSLARRTPQARRRGNALALRRPRFSKRRALDCTRTAGLAHGDPTAPPCGWKSDC